MRNHVVRLYALAATLVIFFLSWAVIAARPWQGEPAAGSGLRLERLTAREAQLRRDTARVQQVLERRFAVYRDANSRPSSPPQVSVLPATAEPVTETRSS